MYVLRMHIQIHMQDGCAFQEVSSLQTSLMRMTSHQSSNSLGLNNAGSGVREVYLSRSPLQKSSYKEETHVTLWRPLPCQFPVPC